MTTIHNSTPNGVALPVRTEGLPDLSAIVGDKVPTRLPVTHVLPVKKDKRSRRDMKELLENARAVGGIKVPLIVYLENETRFYRVADGETRRQVAVLLGFPDVPVYVIDEPADENELDRIQVVANTAQKSMLPMDLAKAIRAAKDRNPGWNQARIGGLFGVEQGTVCKYLHIAELADLLPETAHLLSFSILEALIPLRGSPEALAQVVEEHLARPMTKTGMNRAVAKRLGKFVAAPPVKGKTPGGMVYELPADIALAAAELKALYERVVKGQKDGKSLEAVLS